MAEPLPIGQTMDDVLREVVKRDPHGKCLIAHVTVDDEGTMVTPVWEPHGDHTEPEHCRAANQARLAEEDDTPTL